VPGLVSNVVLDVVCNAFPGAGAGPLPVLEAPGEGGKVVDAGRPPVFDGPNR
jgi:hypothetical protein